MDLRKKLGNMPVRCIGSEKNVRHEDAQSFAPTLTMFKSSPSPPNSTVSVVGKKGKKAWNKSSSSHPLVCTTVVVNVSK
jgi:hypothetical protein